MSNAGFELSVVIRSGIQSVIADHANETVRSGNVEYNRVDRNPCPGFIHRLPCGVTRGDLNIRPAKGKFDIHNNHRNAQIVGAIRGGFTDFLGKFCDGHIIID